MSSRALIRQAGLVWAALLLTVPAAAQRGQTSALSGRVQDATGGPLSGVSVTISSPQLIGGPQTTSTDEAGRYRFAALPPGSYGLSAALQGFETVQRTGMDLFPGLGLTLDILLNISPLETTVEVGASAPAVDVRTSASLEIIERPLLENLPLEHRLVSLHINLAPGIAGNVALGGAAIANPISIDGTSGTSPVQGTPDAAPVVYWLDGPQVISIGANAEYGEYSTARLNAITRSGSNRFSGLAEHVLTRRSWARWNELLEWRDTYGQLGGPVRRNRVWFFGGAENHGTESRVTAFVNQPRAPDEPLLKFDEQKYLLKITGAPGGAVRLEGYVSGTRGESLNGNASPFVSPDALGSFESTQRLENLRLTWR